MKLIVPILNRFDLLVRMVESIDVEATVYVINNSGVRQDFYHANPLVKMHWVDMPSNLGVASSWNLGIKMLPFESRWFISSADCYFQPGDLTLLATAKTDALTLCSKFPHYQTFVVGEEIVKTIGLFDESLHPIYFEDNDYERRLLAAGVPAKFIHAVLHHDNSSTLNSGFHSQNDKTFKANHLLFEKKVAENDLSQGEFDLSIRRINAWDR